MLSPLLTIEDNYCKNFINSVFYIVFNRQNLGKRFSPSDWHGSNQAHFSLSQRERSSAADCRADSWRAVKEMDSKTRNRQNENTKRLGKLGIDLLDANFSLSGMYLTLLKAAHSWQSKTLSKIMYTTNSEKNCSICCR